MTCADGPQFLKQNLERLCGRQNLLARIAFPKFVQLVTNRIPLLELGAAKAC